MTGSSRESILVWTPGTYIPGFARFHACMDSQPGMVPYRVPLSISLEREEDVGGAICFVIRFFARILSFVFWYELNSLDTFHRNTFCKFSTLRIKIASVYL